MEFSLQKELPGRLRVKLAGPVPAADLETGVRAYRRMRRSVRRSERWRFDLRRALHGLGDITAIP